MSALAGVVAERFLNISGRVLKPVWYWSFGWCLRWLRRRKEAKHATSNELFHVGAAGHAIYVREFASDGFLEEHIVSRRQSDIAADDLLDEMPHALRFIEPDELRRLIEAQRKDLEDSPTAWNAEKFALRHIDTSRVGTRELPVLRLGFSATDYASFRTVAGAWEVFTKSGALDELNHDELGDVIAAASHSFGVNLTVETADDNVVLTTRSRRTHSAKALRHISVNEGMSIEDLHPVSRLPDPYVTALRGLQEELGIALPDEPRWRARITFHALICDVTRYEWALLGHVNLTGTTWTDQAIQDRRRLGLSADDWESSKIDFVRMSSVAVARELQDDSNWVGHGYMNLLLSAIYRLKTDRERLLSASRSRKRARKNRRPAS